MRLGWLAVVAISSAAAADPLRFPPLRPLTPAETSNPTFVGVGPGGALILAQTPGQARATLYRASGVGPGAVVQWSAGLDAASFSGRQAVAVGTDTFLIPGYPGVVRVRSTEFGMALVRDSLGDPFVPGWVGAPLGPLAFASESRGWFAIDSATLHLTLLRGGAGAARAVVVGGRWVIPTPEGLWSSDGTAAGTRLSLAVPGGVASVVELPTGLLLLGPSGQLSLADVALSQAAPLPALPGPPTVLGVFGANALLATATGSVALHRTDGRTVTAYATLTEAPGFALDTASSAGIVFRTSSGAMVTDGTAVGTRPLAAVLPIGNRAVRLGGRLLFCGTTSPAGQELWATDGTPAGTQQVLDLNPSPYVGCSGIGMAFAGGVLFAADDGQSGVEPWISDGTAAGTRLLADLAHGGDAAVRALTALGDDVVFGADEVQYSPAIWRSSRATGQLKQLTAELSVNPGWIYGVGAQALFQAAPVGGGWELFVTDGTPEGIHGIGASPALYEPAALSQDTLFFRGNTTGLGTELWATQGTSASTRLWLDLAPGSPSGAPSSLVAAGALLWFTADGASGRELWLRRGDEARIVKDLAPGRPSSTPQLLTPVGDGLFFTAYVPTTGRELYFSQGSAASTQLALDLEPGPDSVDARALTAFGDGVLLAVRRATGHGELWRLERPGATPTRLARFEPGLRVTNLRVVGAQAYFIVGPDAPELWRTDGSVEGTVRLAAVPGNARLETVGNVLYFDAADDAAGVELRRWLPTASAPELVIDGSPGPASSRLDAFVASDGGVYFDLVEASAGSALWFAAADTSGPRVAARLEGTLGAQGFYTSPVQLRFEVSDPDSAVYALEGCDAGTVESDTPTALTFSCAASSLGGTTRTSVTVKRDATAPQLGCPTRVAVPAGTPLALELSAQDAVDPSPTLVVAPALGTVLPSGTTLVDVVATDAAGNRSTCTVRVDVTGAAAPPGVSARCGCQSGEGAGLSLLACALGRWVRRRALRAPTTPA